MPDTTTDQPKRIAQLNDPVTITVRLPVETEEWAEDVIGQQFEDRGANVYRTDDAVIVEVTVQGNFDALATAASVLRDLEDALRDGDITIMDFALNAAAVLPA